MKSSSIALLLTLSFSTAAIQAQNSVDHSGQASKHSVLAVGHGVASTAEVASAAVAVPLIVVGSVALTAGAASANVAESATRHHHHVKCSNRPLVITETTITADLAPNRAIVAKQTQTIKHHH